MGSAGGFAGDVRKPDSVAPRFFQPQISLIAQMLGWL